MVKPELLRTKLAHLSASLERLRAKRPASQESFLSNQDLQDILLHNLQIAIQTCLDIGEHILADQGWEVPATYAQIFEILARHGILDPALAEKLQKVAGFRNLLVHEYAQIDLKKVYGLIENNSGDLEAFSRRIIDYFKV